MGKFSVVKSVSDFVEFAKFFRRSQNPVNKDMDVYTEVLKWQKEMQSKSVDEAQIVLNSNLEKIARVSKYS